MQARISAEYHEEMRTAKYAVLLFRMTLLSGYAIMNEHWNGGFETMTITLEMPQSIERLLEKQWSAELPHKILESIAAEGYREGALSRGQVSELLGLSFQETELFLKARGASHAFTIEDQNADNDALEMERLLTR